jgi:dTDP-glucose 4,6-dehydratase
MKTYLVTGGAGFIGSNYIKLLFDEYKEDVRVINVDKLTYAADLDNLDFLCDEFSYVFIKGDICDYKLIDEIFTKYKIDYVVNFAAESHVDRSIVSSSVFIESNVKGTETLLSVAKKHWYMNEELLSDKLFVQISTDEVYGAIEKGSFDEESPLNPTNPYAASKASADLLVLSYFKTYQFPCVITRCTNNYGPRQHSEKFIPTIITRLFNDEFIPVYGKGKQVRDWLYVMDHVKAIQKVIEQGRIGEVYNIGANYELENIELVHEIIENIYQLSMKDKEKLINYVKDRLGHDQRYSLNCTKIREELNWEPNVKFVDGIRQTIDWYKKKSECGKNGSKI